MRAKTSAHTYVSIALLGAFLPFFCIIWMTMQETGGLWEYTLDDPYIHLAMSEQIANGEYGVNAGEYASASSSIIFPFLLAPFAALDWHWLTPLFWGAIGLLGSTYIWARLVSEIAEESPPITRIYLLAIAFIGPLFLHLVGMSLIGMEHGLQVLAAMMAAYGLVRYAAGDGIRWFLVAGIVLSPMIRFEGLAVACFACGVLFLSGRMRAAFLLGVAALAPVFAHFAYMNSIGLAPLPNSIMAKSALVGGDTYFVAEEEETQIETYINTIKFAFATASGFALMGMGLFWLVGAFVWRRTFGHVGMLLALAAAAVPLAHVFAGSTGIFHIYEVYAWAFGAVVSIYLVSLIWKKNDLAVRMAPVSLLMALIIGGKHFALQMFDIYPHGGAAIAVQQGQMGRFVDEFHQGPVAVNDLGHVAYRNPHYVLDLWGLASRDALDARLAGKDPNWADGLIAHYDVGVIMIYDWWFQGRINPDWIKVAAMTITRPMGALGGSEVAFYAVNESHYQKLRTDLEDFAKTLPEGADFEFVR